MIQVIIILYLLSGANMQMKTYQHQIYMARKTRSNSRPIETGYTYSKLNDGLGVISIYNNNVTPILRSSTEKLPQNTTEVTRSSEKSSVPRSTEKVLNIPAVNVSSATAEYMKSKMKKSFFPEEDNVKSTTSNLEASPTTLDEIVMSYARHDAYRPDDDDVRKDSNMYDGWPYFHRSPYDYEHLKHDNEGDKAKDKRFIYDIIERVIPVREEIKEDIPPTYYNPVTERHEADIGGDNPMYGNQPFFSSILTDYIQPTDEEDPLTFRDLNWGRDFDNQRSYADIDDRNKRVRRLNVDDTTRKPPRNEYNANHKYSSDQKLAVTEKAYNKYNNRGNQNSGDKFQEDHRNGYKHNGDNYRGFKDFVDSFVNKFGSEGHNKDTNYKVNRTQDKGEKKKGFRRVYHKDEYQEDNEFYDNSNNKSVLTENGGSKYNIGGSEAILGSHAAAAIGNEANSINRVGHNARQKYLNRNRDTQNANGYDVDFHRYKDIAKMAAQQNNADYFDPYLE